MNYKSLEKAKLLDLPKDEDGSRKQVLLVIIWGIYRKALISLPMHQITDDLVGPVLRFQVGEKRPNSCLQGAYILVWTLGEQWQRTVIPLPHTRW